MKFKSLRTAAIMLSCVLALTACGSGNKKDDGAAKGKNAAQAMQEKYPTVIDNDGTPIKGGVLKIGYVSDSPFKGVLNGVLATDSNDFAMIGPMTGAFPVNKNYSTKLDSNDTPINVHVDEKKKEIILKINPKFKWSNGEPVTSADIVKTFEIIANQKYIVAAQSPRFGGNMLLVKGIEDYNQGKSPKISGLEVKSPSELVVHLTKVTPSAKWGGVVPSEFVNAKQLEGVPMDKIQSSDALRKNPLSYGPYVVKSLVPGEKIIYEANKYYYRGEPKIKTLEMMIVPSAQQVAAMKAGKFDIMTNCHNSVFDKMKELKNTKISIKPALSYGYLGFKMGKWDAKSNRVQFNPKAKMSDPNLRKAMGYAMNVDQVAEKFLNGLSFRLTSPIIPAFEGLHDEKIEGYPLDLDKANKLLDEAGYKKGKDGFRTDKDGKPLVINYAAMKNSALSQPISDNYIQQWKKIGLNVKYVNGRLLDFQDFYSRIQNDSPDIDVYLAGWGTGSDPNPAGFYAVNEAFNFQRYENPELTKALGAINSEASLDDKVMVENYKNFQKVFQDLGVCVPVTAGFDYIVVNNRVKHYDITADTSWDLSEAEVTAEAPAQ